VSTKTLIGENILKKVLICEYDNPCFRNYNYFSIQKV